MPVREATLRASSKIYRASSRVGASTRATGAGVLPTRVGGPSSIILWQMGNRKAAVLPDPVYAHAIKSIRLSPVGIEYF